jgi:hypothetical protein
MDRSEWELAFALLGGRGWRPQRTTLGVVAHRADGSSLTVDEVASGLSVTLSDARGAALATALLPLTSGVELVEWIVDLFAQRPESGGAGASVAHFPPRGELERTVLTVAYVSYQPEIDALAAEGVHAYVEFDGTALRIFGDFAPSLLLDVSLDDAGIPPLGPDAGDWRVYLTSANGERELVVARGRRREDDARSLAVAVATALAEPP